ncbi:hypothetical protein FAZ97_30620 [Paraburkholderia acidiphila]|uniref:Uncharacterized protein n=2 Tax=Paraburkholderia acidiphila TaxID=2571747 RepID=A0A7Z2JD21_9BURK|nr:hypothetical protein FAZ97_30620 [Paraburkholderia acidiphila]
MAREPKRKSFVISYIESEKKFEIFTLDDSLIEPLKRTTVVSDWTLDQIGHEIGEDAVRRLGITAFDVLSISHPTLKPMLKVRLPRPNLPKDDESIP